MTIFGTTHTDNNPVIYKKTAESTSGAVGFRDLGGDTFRVRLQLSNTGESFRAKLAAALPGWKKPSAYNNEQRFSTMAYSVEERDNALRKATAALMGNEPFITA